MAQKETKTQKEAGKRGSDSFFIMPGFVFNRANFHLNVFYESAGSESLISVFISDGGKKGGRRWVRFSEVTAIETKRKRKYMNPAARLKSYSVKSFN